jgi:integrase
LANRTRELALFNLAIDSKLRVCDEAQGNRVSTRAIIMQQKTHRPVQFEITEQSRESLGTWIIKAQLKSDQYLFPRRIHRLPHLSTRRYARIVDNWVKSIGLNPAFYGTHTMRRKATLVYRKTKNLRAVQLLLGHTKLESTVRYLGIEVDDDLEISEQTEI